MKITIETDMSLDDLAYKLVKAHGDTLITFLEYCWEHEQDPAVWNAIRDWLDENITSHDIAEDLKEIEKAI